MFFQQKINTWSDSFPDNSLSIKNINRKINHLVNELADFKHKNSPAYLLSYPSAIAIKTWQKILPFNPNNLGNWSIKNLGKLHGTRLFERQLIRQMIDLYHARNHNLEGYMTSGGTEGNIFSAWVGRKYLTQKIQQKQICLIKNSLSHYSISKAADIVGIESFNAGINPKDWNLDPTSFQRAIDQLYKKNYRGFLVSLTLGYTLTGTNDNISHIVDVVRKLKTKYKDINFYCWIDASLSGFSLPFTQSNFSPFSNPEISTFIVDFHKLPGSPMPAGLILYKEELRKLIEKKIDYLLEKDSTLLGSRSGIAPVVGWSIINSLGKTGFTELVNNYLEKKNSFIKKYQRQQGVKFINNPNSLGLGIMLDSAITYNKKYFAQKYDLHFQRIKIKFNKYQQKVTISKLFFLGQ